MTSLVILHDATRKHWKFKTKWVGILYLGTGTNPGCPVLPRSFAIFARGAMGQSSITICFVLKECVRCNPGRPTPQI